MPVTGRTDLAAVLLDNTLTRLHIDPSTQNNELHLLASLKVPTTRILTKAFKIAFEKLIARGTTLFPNWTFLRFSKSFFSGVALDHANVDGNVPLLLFMMQQHPNYPVQLIGSGADVTTRNKYANFVVSFSHKPK